MEDHSDVEAGRDVGELVRSVGPSRGWPREGVEKHDEARGVDEGISEGGLRPESQPTCQLRCPTR